MKHRFRDGAMIAAAVLLALAACGMYHLGLGWFIFFMISGAVAQAIARGKNRNQNAWFAAGVLFVGFVLVVALLPKLPEPAPDGMTAEKCPRCNAEQNVPENAPSFTCWRCRYEARLIEMPGMPAAKLPQARPALPPPGWYQDPADPTQHRWWDGARWSDPPPPPPLPQMPPPAEPRGGGGDGRA